MIQDKYLIEILLRNGYKIEDINSDDFKVTKALKEEIVLSRVTDLNELSIFADIVPTVLVGEEDINKQIHYDLSKMLKRYVLKATSPGVKLDKIEFNSKLIVLDGFDLSDTNYKCSGFSNITFKNCCNLDLSTIYNAKIAVQDTEEFDLSCIGEGVFELSCYNIKRVYLSKNTTNSYMVYFNTCTFDNTQGHTISLTNGMEFISVDFMADNLMLKASWIAWRNLKFSELPKALKVADAKYTIELHRMKDLDDSIEDLFTEENVSKIRLIDSSGYDPRKIKPVLDLAKNPDLLESYEALEKILKDNKYIKTIIVFEMLTAEQKEWLRLLASDKEYIYIPFSREDYKDDKNSDIVPSIDDFIKADAIFEEIVSAIDPNWGELEKFKYIYTKLGELISYDINIVYKDDTSNCKRANLITRDIFKSILTGRGVCAGFAEAYQYACRKAGLICYTEKDSDHEYNVITYYDENDELVKSYCDLTWDSERIKRRQPCLYFGKSKETFKFHKKLKEANTVDVPETKIAEIDKTICYERETAYGQIISKALKMENELERAQYIIEEISKVKSLYLMSNDEVVKFAKYMLLNARINKENVGIAKGFAGKDKNELNDPRVILWLKDTTNGGEKIQYWTFNKAKQKFMALDKETLEDLILSGMLEFYGDEGLPQISTYKRKSDIEH